MTTSTPPQVSLTPASTLPGAGAGAGFVSELPKSYTPANAEPQIRAKWDDARAFHAHAPTSGGEKPFCILIPPPNVTAALHLGHAFNNTLQDVLVRYHRMLGDSTLWMPGTDHAGIATQAVVEKRLLLQGKKRTDFSREEFIAKVQEWKDEYEATIISQLKVMGCSCDFERTRFTMDEVCAKAVREAFFRLFKDGLIYRGKRLVNWDPVTQTALADDEVEMEEVQGHMYYLRYPVIDDAPAGLAASRQASASGAQYVTVATTRPETMLGDTAVAMNPKDPRAAQFVGKFVRLPIVNRVIPIIADDYVVRPVEFGGDENDAKAKIATGFLKVTPAHDDNDYQIGQRHNLPIVNVFAPDASISDKHGWPSEDVSDEAKQFLGLSREAARKKIVEWFKAKGLLEDVKPYTHSVGHSYRSHVPIEPYLSDQWYVKVTDDRLRGEALRAMVQDQYEDAESTNSRVATRPRVDDASAHTAMLPGSRSDPAKGDKSSSSLHEGDDALRFYPARYARTFQAWHENLRDWCISRQLWWGHRIPVWHKRVTLTEKTWEKEILGTGLDHIIDPGRPVLGGLLIVGSKKTTTKTPIAWVSDGDRQEALAIVRVSDGKLHDLSADTLIPVTRSTEGEYDIYVCCDEASGQYLEGQGYERDPDVLDTWFSSGLWPLSTMGWPTPEDFLREIPEGSALLNTFNPSSVLCTAREIITLWVSRMVMFNRYFRDGKLPFEHVYVHAMIQDGHGQKMSKSLGNGVDPRDIIHSHGADALRFVMTKLATATQDVRLPVDMICPHPGCGETFQPKEITTSSDCRVADAIQTCPKCKKKLVSGYGAATGIATPTDEMPLARNSSRKFDEGRNFANKLWNAVRFALSNLEASRDQGIEASRGEMALVDKWIITRLHRTLHAVEDALAEYQFNAYADAMYDFIWRDFCDWYLEAIKPTVKSSPAQQQVLRTVLNASLRLLHPIMPFVTETLWPPVAASGGGFAGLEGIKLPASDLLATARWPDIKCSVDDKQALATFERVQALVNAIRTLRAERQVPPKKRIRIAAGAEVLELIKTAGGVVEALAGIEEVTVLSGGAKPQAARGTAGAIPLAFEGGEILCGGLVDAVDASTERTRLTKLIEEKNRAIAGFRGKLSNEGYVNKAPADKVQETRQLLAQAEADAAAAQRALQSLDA